MSSPYQNARAPTEISNFPDKLLVRLILLIYEKFEDILELVTPILTIIVICVN
jgi:hypothetical protein